MVLHRGMGGSVVTDFVCFTKMNYSYDYLKLELKPIVTIPAAGVTYCHHPGSWCDLLSPSRQLV